ncbi:MAG TPA: response regulator [Planctomycetes bacterium]|nr:response regulator [Planctomycetota bacterium]
MASTAISILVVDDDRPVLLTVQEIVEELGHRCFAADSMSMAFEIAAHHLIQAAIMDMHLGDATGLETLRRLRRLYSPLDCVLMSGDFTQEIRREAEQLGVRGVLEKPLDLENVRTAVRALAS